MPRFKQSACYILFSFILHINISFAETIVDTVWGKEKITSPLIEELIKTKPVQRLKYIDQSGPLVYFGLAPKFSRYEHSIGVLLLLQKAKAPIAEQVAGLLHDVSHTAFSHLGDHLFYKDNEEKSYQDLIHLQFLQKYHVDEVTGKYDIGISKLDPDLHEYTALERPQPDLCADRIQYIVHTGVILNKINKIDANQIIQDLHFENGTWYFTDKLLAKKFAVLSLEFTEELWSSPWNFVFYEYFSKILKRTFAAKQITADDIKYGVDQEVLDKLYKIKDPKIHKALAHLPNIHQIFKVVEYGNGEFNTTPKFRGVDPWVLKKGKYRRLTEIDKEYKNLFEMTKAWCKKGYGVRLLKEYALVF